MSSRPHVRALGWALAAALIGCGGGRESTSALSPASAVSSAPGAPASAAHAPAAQPQAPATSAPADPAAEPGASGPLAPVGWMIGSWAAALPDGSTVEETWALDGDVLKGTGRTLAKDGKELREVLRVEARPGGAIVYVAQPGGAEAPTDFTRDPRTSGPSHAQFVNDQHDWPTRIRYERVGDELRVRVRGRPGQADESFTLKKR